MSHKHRQSSVGNRKPIIFLGGAYLPLGAEWGVRTPLAETLQDRTDKQMDRTNSLWWRHINPYTAA